MATVTRPDLSGLPGAAGVVFRDVSWDDYAAMLRIVGERPIRVTYDRRTMEVFMPSLGHEDDAYLLGRIVDTVTEEAAVPVKAGRTTTHKRSDLDRGAEPDQCYWLGANALRMAGKRRLDLGRDPPPDLVIEVDVSRSSLERLPIFAAMGVPEVWRPTGQALEFLHLAPDGSYQPHDESRHFPTLSSAEVARALDRGRSGEETGWIREFRADVRERLVPRPQEGGANPP